MVSCKVPVIDPSKLFCGLQVIDTPRVRLEGGLILMARCHDRDVYYIPGGKRKAGETIRWR